MRKFIILFVSLVLSGLWPASSQGQSLSGEGVIFASNYPLAYFAQRICGRPEQVIFPEVKGNPTLWRPSIEDILKIQSARVILLNGATYEKWAERVSLPTWRVVDTSGAFRDRYMFHSDGVTHSHGPKGAHSHEYTVFATWLDFSQAAAQAESVRDALVAAGQGSEAELTKNYEALQRDLLTLDKSVAGITSGHEGAPFFASRPVYDYFARRYKLNIKAVLLEANARPDDIAWDGLEYYRQDHPASWLIWESAPLPEVVSFLGARGMGGIVFDPCANQPDEGDFLTVMQQNVRNLGRAFQ
jgi:zinc transport system substrate-binding protein